MTRPRRRSAAAVLLRVTMSLGLVVGMMAVPSVRVAAVDPPAISVAWSVDPPVSTGQIVLTHLAPAPAGVFVAGFTGGVLDGAVSAGGNDVVVARYDDQGSIVWARQFGTVVHDELLDLASTHDALYVLYAVPADAYEPGFLVPQVVLVKLDPDRHRALAPFAGQGRELRRRDRGDVLWGCRPGDDTRGDLRRARDTSCGDPRLPCRWVARLGGSSLWGSVRQQLRVGQGCRGRQERCDPHRDAISGVARRGECLRSPLQPRRKPAVGALPRG